MTPTGREKLKGAITAVYDKDPTDARWMDDAGFMQYSAFTTKYMPRDEQADARVANGFGVAARLMVHVLEQCSADLSRKNIMYQAANINGLELPMLLPGVRIGTSASNYHPMRQMQLASFNGSSWELFGGRCHENGIWPRTIWKSQFGLRPRWRLAKSGTLLLGGRGACGGR